MRNTNLHRNSRKRKPARSGATTVEFALVAPVLFMILTGAIEFARLNQVVNATSFAAYQGCREAIIPGGTASAATSGAQQVLSSNLVNTSTIVVTPSTITNDTNTVTVQVTVNVNDVTWITPRFASGKSITRSCTLTREKTNE